MTDPNEDDDALFKGPSLNAEGRLEGRFGAMENPVPLNTHPGVPPVAGSTAAQAAFQPPPAPAAPPPPEIAARKPPAYEARIERFRAENEARTSSGRAAALRIVIGLLLLGIALAVSFAVLRPKLPGAKTAGVTSPNVLQLLQGERPPMLINSTPSGAKLYVGQELVGETPWAGDNRWAGEKVPFRIEAKGYQPYTGTFQGDATVTLEVTLKR
ncbi:MAG: PEGA domain-containing protein [Myxococcaceae bacterium]